MALCYIASNALPLLAAATTNTAIAPTHNKYKFAVKEVEMLTARAEAEEQSARLAEAASTLRHALDTTKRELGPDHPDVAALCIGLGAVCRKQGNKEEAQELASRARFVAERVGTSNLTLVAASLNLSAMVAADSAKLSEAISLLQQGLTIAIKADGLDAQVELALRLNLGVVMHVNGESDEGLRSLLEGCRFAEKAYGPECLEVAQALNNISVVQAHLGRTNEALLSLDRSLAIRKKLLPSGHPALAESLGNKANLQADMGDIAGALQLHLEALAIAERAHGTEHQDVAAICANLGTVYHRLGDLPQANAACRRSLVIREKLLGPNHPVVADNLELLGRIQMDSWAFSDALQSFRRAVSVRQQSQGESHPELADSLDTLALCYEYSGREAEACELLGRAVEIKRKALGDTHLDTLHLLERYLSAQIRLGRDEIPLLKKIVQMRVDELGPLHPDAAASLSNLSSILASRGQVAEALEYSSQSLALLRNRCGEAHPSTILVLRDLSGLYLAAGKFGDAVTATDLLVRAEREWLLGQLGGTSPLGNLAFDLGLLNDIARFQSLYLLDIRQYSSLRASQAAEQLVLCKGLQEELAATQMLLETDPNAATRDLWERYRALSRRIAELHKTSFKTAEGEMRRTSLQNEAEGLRGDLRRRSSQIEARMRASTVTLLDVRKCLPPGSALLDFCAFRRLESHVWAGGFRELRYAAYLTYERHGDSSNIDHVRVDLGEARLIDAAVEAITKRMSAGQFAASDLSNAVQRLSELVYAPLARHLTNVSHLIVCPDGQLSRLPFEMLRHDGKFLIEEKTISYVGSGREVVRLAGGGKAVQTNAPVVVGNPDFNLELARSSRREEAPLNLPLAGTHAGFGQSLLTSAATRSLSRDFRGLSFPPLPGAEDEARSVAGLLGKDAVLRLGAHAREADLKRVVSPRVLHLATHGFFLPDQEFRQTNASLSGLTGLGSLSAFRPPPGQDWENPMVRCGLALAGANHACQITNALVEDGLLTGLEASLLNLQGTELVILSACDSGTGDVKIGEGVMSLRRAFRIAGAESVLASHWQVSDKATRLLMTEFMRRWQAGEPRAQAWREAQLTLLRSKEFSNPYFWAAFTLTGQWR